jgi:hypothetical protein
MATTQEFNRYSIATFDWQKSLAFANEARKHPTNTTVYEALLFAAIVCYYRPFSPNEKGANPPAASHLRIEDFPTLSKEELALHESIRMLRHQALAHSAFAFNPTRLTEETNVIVSKPFSLLVQLFDIEVFVQLISKLELACHHKRADHVPEQRL